MPKSLILTFLLVLCSPLVGQGFWEHEEERSAYLDLVWEYHLDNFSQRNYSRGVENLFRSFEEKTKKMLVPGKRRKAGIKIYTNSGSGIATPTELVIAVIDKLVQRGFKRSELFILDVSERDLRNSGFLPPLSKKAIEVTFDRVPVYILETENYYDELWYHESPLPSQSQLAHSAELIGGYGEEKGVSDRKSFLAKPLITDVDFWINLPMALDNQIFGITGALTNATLWAISNRDRFFVSPANGPIAIAEIAAIPELKSGWVFSIISLERYQFIGGPIFNSLYTRSEPLLWMSINPVVLDALVMERINYHKKENGFTRIVRNTQVFNYAQSLGLGHYNRKKIRWIHLP